MQGSSVGGHMGGRLSLGNPRAIDVVPWGVGLALLLYSAIAVPFAAAAILLVAVMASLTGVRWAVRALGILVLVRAGNPAILGDLTGPVALLGWLVLAVAGSRIYLSALPGGGGRAKLFLWLVVFSAAVVLLSFAASDYLGVSLFKVGSFFFGAGAVLLGLRHLSMRGICPWRDVQVCWFGVLVASLPLALFPGVGYFLDGEGFQGVMNHPQYLAAFCAPILVWAGVEVLLRGVRAGPIAWFLLALALLEAFLTRGRTSIVAACVAGVLAIIYAAMGRRCWLDELRKSRFFTRVLAAVAVMAILLAVYPEVIAESLFSFVYKRDVGDVSLAESLETSRGFLIAEEIANFLGSPLAGIGFGVSRSAIHPFQPVIEPYTGLAIGASTEKANIVVALLEEVGVFGTIAFLPFIAALLRQVKQRAPFSIGAAAIGAFAVNISEMVFFSMGGLGLYVMLLMGLAAYFPWSAGVAEPPLVSEQNE